MRVAALLAGVFLFAAAPLPARSECSTSALKGFYTWYLAQPNHEWTAHFSQVRSSFDPSLYTMLETVLHSKANQQEPVLDFDPFVNAQWDATTYALGKPVSNGDAVRVLVTLNLSGKPNPTTKLTAVLRENAADHCLINNLIYSPTFNLREFLAKELKKGGN